MTVDLAAIRLANTLRLRAEFVAKRSTSAEGLQKALPEVAFARKLEISPSYWTQLKTRRRHIGETLARQFERHMGKPKNWLDEDHGTGPVTPLSSVPMDPGERAVVQLVLGAYRAAPEETKEAIERLYDTVTATRLKRRKAR
jgi:hypothetical protein